MSNAPKQQFNARLSAEAHAIIERRAIQHGGKAGAVEAALALLDGQTAPPAAPAPAPQASAPAPATDLPAALEAAAKELRRLQRLARFAKST